MRSSVEWVSRLFFAIFGRAAFSKKKKLLRSTMSSPDETETTSPLSHLVREADATLAARPQTPTDDDPMSVRRAALGEAGRLLCSDAAVNNNNVNNDNNNNNNNNNSAENGDDIAATKPSLQLVQLKKFATDATVREIGELMNQKRSDSASSNSASNNSASIAPGSAALPSILRYLDTTMHAANLAYAIDQWSARKPFNIDNLTSFALSASDLAALSRVPPSAEAFQLAFPAKALFNDAHNQNHHCGYVLRARHSMFHYICAKGAACRSECAEVLSGAALAQHVLECYADECKGLPRKKPEVLVHVYDRVSVEIGLVGPANKCPAGVVALKALMDCHYDNVLSQSTAETIIDRIKVLGNEARVNEARDDEVLDNDEAHDNETQTPDTNCDARDKEVLDFTLATSGDASRAPAPSDETSDSARTGGGVLDEALPDLGTSLSRALDNQAPTASNAVHDNDAGDHAAQAPVAGDEVEAAATGDEAHFKVLAFGNVSPVFHYKQTPMQVPADEADKQYANDTELPMFDEWRAPRNESSQRAPTGTLSASSSRLSKRKLRFGDDDDDGGGDNGASSSSESTKGDVGMAHSPKSKRTALATDILPIAALLAPLSIVN
jgi:hypothetical protein